MSGDDAAALVTFAGENAVPVANVEQELARLWQAVGESTQDSEQSGAPAGQVTRACLWNLIYYTLPKLDGDPAAVREHHELLAAVTTAVPARILYLETREGQDASPDGREIEAHVSANCIRSAGGASLVCAEEITLVGYGTRGPNHFPSVARALRTPDLPVGLLWLEELPHKGRLLRELLEICHRLVVDSHEASDVSELADFHRLLGESPTSVADIGWMRLHPVRHLLAGLFDPPEFSEKLRQLEEIHIETTTAGRIPGFLLAGWLLSRCGHDQIKATPRGSGDIQYQWEIERDGGRFPLFFSAHEGEGGGDDLISVTIKAGGGEFGMRQQDGEHVILRSPLADEQRLALHGWDTSELVVAALGSRGLDPVYGDALAVAAALAEAEAWNR